MHELGIAASTLELVLQHARSAEADRVSSVSVQMGAVSGVDPEAFRFAFEAVCAGTLADGAELRIEVLPAIARCCMCDADFTVGDDPIYLCPRCGAFSGSVQQGRELILSRIELSQPMFES